MTAVEIIAEGLEFPEGPIAMPDGSVILVEVRRQTLTRVWKGRSEVIAHLGGGPNGAAFGPDGAVYVTNNGGLDWTSGGLAAADYDCGRIERVDLSTGKVERVFDKINGVRLSAPNDLVFDREGGFWFTDFGKTFARSRDRSGLYYAKPDGSLIREAAYGFIGLNGVGLSLDESTVYAAETESARLWAFELSAPGQCKPGRSSRPGHCVATQSEFVAFDSLAVQEDGAVCVATIIKGGVTTIAPDGRSTHTALPDPVVTNLCFGGADMRDAFATLSYGGKLAKIRWPKPGLTLNFAPY